MTPLRIAVAGTWESEAFQQGYPSTFAHSVKEKSYHRVVCPTTVTKGDRKRPLAWSFHIEDADHVYGTFRMHNLRNTMGYTERGVSVGGEQAVLSAGNYASYVYPYNKALGRLYDGIRGNVDLAIDFAQVNQTRSMIRNSIRTILSYARSWRQGISGVSGSASNAWLQWQYGIRPTMQTIYDLAEKQIELTCRPVTFRGRATNLNRGQFVTTSYTSSRVPSYVDWETSARTEVKVRCSVSNANIHALSHYTSLNPASILWEMTPYSFVADWFIDVGGYLRSAETALLTGLVFHSGYRTDSYKGTAVRRTVGTAYNSGSYYTISTGCRHYERGMSRTPLGGMPLPEIPRVEAKLGSQRLLSAASLLRQLLH